MKKHKNTGKSYQVNNDAERDRYRVLKAASEKAQREKEKLATTSLKDLIR